MNREEITANELKLHSIADWDKTWFLITSGSFAQHQFNSMTISWGSIGVMWNKPFVQIAIRPVRFTHSFLEIYPDFTICAFSSKYKKTLKVLGSKSGREMDKITKSGLTPISCRHVTAPGYAEASLVIECKIMFKALFSPSQFVDPKIESEYPLKDYHTSYYGEIVYIEGDRLQYT